MTSMVMLLTSSDGLTTPPGALQQDGSGEAAAHAPLTLLVVDRLYHRCSLFLRPTT
jgi:hypothetical protein